MTYEINSRVTTSLTLHCDARNCGQIEDHDRDPERLSSKITLDVTDHELTADPLSVFISATTTLPGSGWHMTVSMPESLRTEVKFYCSPDCLVSGVTPAGSGETGKAPEQRAEPRFAWRPVFASARSIIAYGNTASKLRHLFINGSRVPACSDDLMLSNEWVGVVQDAVDKRFPEKCPACAGVANTFIPHPTPSQED